MLLIPVDPLMINLGFAENLDQLTPEVALDKVFEADDLGARKYVNLKMAGLYVLSRLAASQSMGLIRPAFKNMKAARTLCATLCACADQTISSIA